MGWLALILWPGIFLLIAVVGRSIAGGFGTLLFYGGLVLAGLSFYSQIKYQLDKKRAMSSLRLDSSSLLGGKTERHQEAIIAGCVIAQNEEEQVYRNHVQLFSSEFSPAQPTKIGITRSHVFVSLFPIWGYLHKHGEDGLESVIERVMAHTTKSLDLALKRKLDAEFDVQWFKTQIANIQVIVERGGTGALGGDTPQEVADLVEVMHQNFIASVGDLNYTTEARDRFHLIFLGSMPSRMILAGDSADSLE